MAGGFIPCTTNADCPINEGPEAPIGARDVCAYPTDGGCTAMGRCVLPQANAGCVGNMVPPLVCTCSGKTTGLPGLSCGVGTPGYVSTPIVSPTSGPCGDSGGVGQVCAGFANTPCPSGEYCDNFPANDICGGGDSTGTCKLIPGGCTTDCPGVCGCDNKTYCNTCEANNAGVSVRQAGACPDGG